MAIINNWLEKFLKIQVISYKPMWISSHTLVRKVLQDRESFLSVIYPLCTGTWGNTSHILCHATVTVSV